MPKASCVLLSYPASGIMAPAGTGCPKAMSSLTPAMGSPPAAGWLCIILEFVPIPTVNFAKEVLLPNLILEAVGRWRYRPNSNWYFGYIGLFLSALILAWLGGLFARWCAQRSMRHTDLD